MREKSGLAWGLLSVGARVAAAAACAAGVGPGARLFLARGPHPMLGSSVGGNNLGCPHDCAGAAMYRPSQHHAQSTPHTRTPPGHGCSCSALVGSGLVWSGLVQAQVQSAASARHLSFHKSLPLHAFLSPVPSLSSLLTTLVIPELDSSVSKGHCVVASDSTLPSTLAS